MHLSSITTRATVTLTVEITLPAQCWGQKEPGLGRALAEAKINASQRVSDLISHPAPGNTSKAKLVRVDKVSITVEESQ